MFSGFVCFCKHLGFYNLWWYAAFARHICDKVIYIQWFVEDIV